MKRFLITAAGLPLCATLLAGTCAFGLLYFTSFESSKYEADKQLVGQAGSTGLQTPDAAKVVKGRLTARTGRKAVECWAGDLDPLPAPNDWLVLGAWEKLIDFDTPKVPAVVHVRADVRLVGPDTGAGPGNDLLSANLMARNAKALGARRAPWFYLSSNGSVYANAHSESGSQFYKFETPIKNGAWNRLRMALNYKTHMCDFFVNGKKIGALEFGGTGERFTSVLLEMAAWNHPSFDVKPYKAYWDNVVAWAEPAK